MKVGDRIVAFQDNEGSWSYDLPDKSLGTIIDKDRYGDWVVQFDNYHQPQYILPGCKYEYEEIYHSPLYKAMRES